MIVMAKKSTKLEALQQMFSENNITPDTIEKSDALISEIKKLAERVPDYRHESYIRHPLCSIIMIVFFAVLANANEWSEIESFAKRKEKWLCRHLDLPYGVPTDDTYRLVIGNIDTKYFFEGTVALLINSIEELLKIQKDRPAVHEKAVVSVDGKESRGSKRKDSQSGAVKAYQTLNVYSDDYGMCVAQEFIEKKTNEIPAAQEVLKRMDLTNTIVTADAMNCQKGTVAVIAGAGGDYVLGLKGNHGTFYAEAVEYFDAEKQEELKQGQEYKKTVEKEHGGIVSREYFISEDTEWYPDRKEWKNLKSFGMVRKSLEKADGGSITESRYYICSIPADVDELERAVRRHWGVENHVHWQLDFTFQDDKNTSMAGTGAKNLQTMKKIALSILRLVKDSYRISMKRIRYELSLDYETEIEKILSLLNVESVKQALGKQGIL